MSRLGFFLDNAEILEVQNKGGVTVATVTATGATKNACIRGARKKVSSIIPAPEQNFINETQLGNTGRFRKQYMFNISDNGDS